MTFKENYSYGDRVMWYRHDDHLTEKQRRGTVIGTDIDNGLTTVEWDDGSETEVFTNYLEVEEPTPEGGW